MRNASLWRCMMAQLRMDAGSSYYHFAPERCPRASPEGHPILSAMESCTVPGPNLMICTGWQHLAGLALKDDHA